MYLLQWNEEKGRYNQVVATKEEEEMVKDLNFMVKRIHGFNNKAKAEELSESEHKVYEELMTKCENIEKRLKIKMNYE